MRRLILFALRGYQRFVSPHKGFACAYRVHTGGASCSTLGLRAVRRFGALRGLGVLRRRLHLCGVAHRRFMTPLRRPPSAQRGDCDPGCDLPCDVCDPGSCDWNDRARRRRRKDEKEDRIHVPPARRRAG